MTIQDPPYHIHEEAFAGRDVFDVHIFTDIARGDTPVVLATRDVEDLAKLLQDPDTRHLVRFELYGKRLGSEGHQFIWPLPSLVPAAIASTQSELDRGAAALVGIDANQRALLLEPTEPLDLTRWLFQTCRDCRGIGLVGRDGTACVCARYGTFTGKERLNLIHQVFVRMTGHPDLVRGIEEQCRRAGVVIPMAASV